MSASNTSTVNQCILAGAYDGPQGLPTPERRAASSAGAVICRRPLPTWPRCRRGGTIPGRRASAPVLHAALARAQHAELVALGIGEDHPGVVGCLPDIHSPGAMCL